MRLQGKVIVITGGADGIGKSLAYGIAREGATAVIVDINEQKLQATKDAMIGEGLSCEAFLMNVTKEDQIEKVIAELINKFGHIDGWVNNAGITSKSPLFETTTQEYDRIMEINLKGTFLCCKAVAKVMVEQKSGSIINISSIAGRTGGGLLGTCVYAASKGGVISFTKGIARELASSKVRANIVAPGSIDTAMTLENHTKESYEASIRQIPLHRRGLPEDIVGAVVFLLSDESSFMTGATLDVNGGSFMY